MREEIVPRNGIKIGIDTWKRNRHREMGSYYVGKKIWERSFFVPGVARSTSVMARCSALLP
tara:strand:- start:295 stop:477 length:183 start_codon:yes stop_codon:yes gene_type:complete